MAWSSGSDGVQRDVRIKCGDFGANQRRHGVRGRVTANDQHELRGISPIRDVHHRVNVLKILLTNRRRQADDRGAGRRHRGRGVRHRQADSAAYRIFIRKEHRGQALIDDGTLGSGHGIPIDERTSAQQSQAKRFEVAASNRHVRDDRLRFARQGSPSVYRHLPRRSTGEGDDIGERGRRDARNRVEPLLQSLVGRNALLWRAVLLGRAEKAALSRHVSRRRPNRRDRRQESCASSARRPRARPASMPAPRSEAQSSAGAFPRRSSQSSPPLSKSGWPPTLILEQRVTGRQEMPCRDTRPRQTGQLARQWSTGCSRGT